ncbi:MAG: hypothetical protein QXT28_10325 [Thermofilaceae archaeon]
MTRVDREVFNGLVREAVDALDGVKSIVSMSVGKFSRVGGRGSA